MISDAEFEALTDTLIPGLRGLLAPGMTLDLARTQDHDGGWSWCGDHITIQIGPHSAMVDVLEFALDAMIQMHRHRLLDPEGPVELALQDLGREAVRRGVSPWRS